MNKSYYKIASELIRHVSNFDRILLMDKKTIPIQTFMFRESYKNLYCVAKDKKIYDSPFYTHIRYIYGDPGNTHFPPSFFKMVIWQSSKDENVDRVILKEAFRLVEPEGYVVSIKCKRKDEEYDKQEKCADFRKEIYNIDNFRMTFYIKDKKTYVLSKSCDGLSLLLYSKERGGLSEYSRNLKTRFQNEMGIKAQEIFKPSEAEFDIVIIEFESGLPSANRLMDDVLFLKSSGRKIFIEIHDWLTRNLFTQHEFETLEANATLLYRSNENAELDNAKKYYLCPHVSYRTLPPCNSKKSQNRRIVIGSFGFASHSKNFEKIVRLAINLDVEARLIISQNKERSLRIHKSLIERIGSYKEVEIINEKDQPLTFDKKIIIRSGFLDNIELASFLSECTHFVFAHKSHYWASGTMTFAKQFRKPILAIDSFQARQAQVFRVKVFSRLDEIIGGLNQLVKSMLKLDSKRGKYAIRRIYNGIRYRSISLRDFERQIDVPRDEDGLIYIQKAIDSVIRTNQALKESE